MLGEEMVAFADASLEQLGIPTAFGNLKVDGADDFHAPKSGLLYFHNFGFQLFLSCFSPLFVGFCQGSISHAETSASGQHHEDDLILSTINRKAIHVFAVMNTGMRFPSGKVRKRATRFFETSF